MNTNHSKTLFAGPWVGEFGWELFAWHGFLRKLSKKYDHTVMACRTGHNLLYEDFADDIINYDPEFEDTNMWINYGESGFHRDFHKYYTAHVPESKLTIVQFDSYKSRWWIDEKWNNRQDFMSFGTINETKKKFDILMIVRDTDKCFTWFRNWPESHATQFASLMLSRGFTIVCVGKSDSAKWIPGTWDARDLPLDRLANLMADARVIVGPQCGPTHFASLCLLPQVCWQTKSEHATRVETKWNPFHTPTITLPSDDSYWKYHKMWTPPMEDIISSVNTFLTRRIL